MEYSSTPSTLSMPSGTSPIKVVTGSYFTCTHADNGKVYCIGDNARGQLGDFTTINRYTLDAVKVDPFNDLNEVQDIAAQYQHACAIYQQASKVYCWGRNTENQMDWNGTSGVKMVTVTQSATCVVFKNAPTVVQCKGWSNWNDRSYDMIQPITKLTSGTHHVCALLDNGTAACFGNNSYGELGNGATGLTFDTFTLVKENETTELQGIIDINAGADSTCVVVANGNGTPMCFGRNGGYQLGNSNNTVNPKYPTPLDVTFPDGVVPVSAHVGTFTGYAVMSDESVYSWGTNTRLSLGNKSTDRDLKIGDTVEPAALVNFNAPVSISICNDFKNPVKTGIS